MSVGLFRFGLCASRTNVGSVPCGSNNNFTFNDSVRLGSWNLNIFTVRLDSVPRVWKNSPVWFGSASVFYRFVLVRFLNMSGSFRFRVKRLGSVGFGSAGSICVLLPSCNEQHSNNEFTIIDTCVSSRCARAPPPMRSPSVPNSKCYGSYKPTNSIAITKHDNSSRLM